MKTKPSKILVRKCLYCQETITIRYIRQHFSCPHCDEPLESNIWSVFSWASFLWLLLIGSSLVEKFSVQFGICDESSYLNCILPLEVTLDVLIIFLMSCVFLKLKKAE